MTERLYCAIGDVHGQADQLRELHASIRLHHTQRFSDLRLTFVHLGDYVDRGPDACDVIDQLIAMERVTDFDVINLRGNHEIMMLEGIAGVGYGDDPLGYWKRWGGLETLDSYYQRGLDGPYDHHLEWMESLPNFYHDKARGLYFVHAGIEPNNFPNDDQNTLLWTRSNRFFDTENWDNPALKDVTIVHGHTPTEDSTPDIAGNQQRINVDTGAVYGGPLTAVLLAPRKAAEFLYEW